MEICKFLTSCLHSVESALDKYLPEKERNAVKQIMFGLNQGELVKKLEVPAEAAKIAKANNFDISLRFEHLVIVYLCI